MAALATVELVRRLGGVDDALSYRLWQFTDEAALDGMLTDLIDAVSAFLTSKAGTYYTQTADTNLQSRFRYAEAFKVLALAFEPLKARRVTATHFPYLQEGSERFEALIDTDWEARYQEFIGEFISDAGTDTYSQGVFETTEPVDRSTVDVVTTRNADILAEANGWTPWPLP